MEDVHWECGESAGYVGLESPKISISTSCPEGTMIVLLFDRVPDRLRVYTWRISFSFKFHRKLPENQPAPRTSLDLKLPERLSGKVLARGRPSVHRKTFHCDAPSRHVLRVNSISLMGREEGQNPFVLSPTCVCAEVDCVTTIAAQGQWPVGKGGPDKGGPLQVITVKDRKRHGIRSGVRPPVLSGRTVTAFAPITLANRLCHRLICLGAALLPFAHLHSVSQKRTNRIGFFLFFLKAEHKAGKTLSGVLGTRCPGPIMLTESTPSCIKQRKGVSMTMSTGFRAESWLLCLSGFGWLRSG